MPKKTRAKSPTGRLSDQQLDILEFFATRGAATGVASMFINWSPTNWVGKEDGENTKDRVAAASRRVKSLIDRGLLERDGRQIAITKRGWTVLTSRKEHVSKLLELHKSVKAFEELYARRLAVFETFALIKTMITGEQKMTWSDDRENPDMREPSPAEDKRSEMLWHTITTLFFLDIQLSRELKELLSERTLHAEAIFG